VIGLKATSRIVRIPRRLLPSWTFTVEWRERLAEVAFGLTASAHELPVIARGVAVVRSVEDGRATGIVITSSFARPHRLMAWAVRGQRTVEFVFDHPVGRRRDVNGLPGSYRLVATSQRVRDRLTALNPAVEVALLSHLPVETGVIAEKSSRVLEALARVSAAPEGWMLFFGAMHGKKNLSSVVELTRQLPASIGLLVAGDPLHDGKELISVAQSAMTTHPHLAVIADRIRDGELAALLGARPVVLIADNRGNISLSGVVIDAVGSGGTVVAPADCASGDVTSACGLGAVYEEPTAGSIVAAFRSAAHSPGAERRSALSGQGLLTGVAWGSRLLELLGITRCEGRGVQAGEGTRVGQVR